VELCVGVARSASCRATFESALRQTQAAARHAGALSESLAANRAPLASEDSERQHLRAQVQRRPGPGSGAPKCWRMTGLPFVRMPQGPNHELLVGITPRGLLGVSLKDTTGE
jgi:anti-sigma factor RsiW